MNNASRMIMIRTDFIGWHNWPEAPEGRFYLRDRHRHKFTIQAEISVEHNDREVEFHDLLSVVSGGLPGLDESNLGRMSCEDIAEGVIKTICATYPHRLVVCEVWEDGEVGARVTYDDHPF